MGNPKTKTGAGRESTTTATARKSTSYAACFERFVPEAEQLDPAEVEVCRADVRIAFANVKCGVEAVCGEPARVRKALPLLPVDEVLALPDLGRALVFASMQVTGRPASAREVDAKLAVVSKLREPMLTVAETLAERKLLPKADVAAIRTGTGKFDMASDGVALVGLYRKHAGKIRGKHPFTAEEMNELLEASEWLLDHLTPNGARPPAATRKRDAEEMRDRLWTLMVRRHAHLRTIGYYFHGDDFENVTPRLQSRVAGVTGIEDEMPLEGEASGASGADGTNGANGANGAVHAIAAP